MGREADRGLDTAHSGPIDQPTAPQRGPTNFAVRVCPHTSRRKGETASRAPNSRPPDLTPRSPWFLLQWTRRVSCAISCRLFSLFRSRSRARRGGNGSDGPPPFDRPPPHRPLTELRRAFLSRDRSYSRLFCRLRLRTFVRRPAGSRLGPWSQLEDGGDSGHPRAAWPPAIYPRRDRDQPNLPAPPAGA